MATSATGVSFYVGIGNGGWQQTYHKEEKVKPKPIVQPKDSYVEKKDYSFGTSPKALTSKSSDGYGSPNKSPKL